MYKGARRLKLATHIMASEQERHAARDEPCGSFGIISRSPVTRARRRLSVEDCPQGMHQDTRTDVQTVGPMCWLRLRRQEGRTLSVRGRTFCECFVNAIYECMLHLPDHSIIYTTVQAEIGATKLSQALQGHTHSRWMASSMCSHMHCGRLPSVYSLRVVNHSTGQANQRQRRSFLLPHVPSPDWMTPSFEN